MKRLPFLLAIASISVLSSSAIAKDEASDASMAFWLAAE
jgi:hypothetical protein